MDPALDSPLWAYMYVYPGKTQGDTQWVEGREGESSLVYTFIHPLAFTEHRLCAGHRVRCWITGLVFCQRNIRFSTESGT